MRRVVVVLACALVLTAVLRAQDPADDQWNLDVMRGLRALHVYVRPVSPVAEEAGLHHDVLRADIEHRLRREGIALVVTLPEPGDAPEDGWAILRLNVDDLRKGDDPSGHHDFWLALDLMQQAAIAGRPSVRAHIATWSAGAAGSHRSAELSTVVREALRLALDDFIRDFRAANDGEREAPISADAADPADANPEGD
jgi:hypothetical protein